MPLTGVHDATAVLVCVGLDMTVRVTREKGFKVKDENWKNQCPEKMPSCLKNASQKIRCQPPVTFIYTCNLYTKRQKWLINDSETVTVTN